MPPQADRKTTEARRSLWGTWRNAFGHLQRGAARLRRHAAIRRPRSDFVVAGLGIALGLGCAVFPWYIFFNQDQFGVRAVKFEGNNDQQAPILLGSDGEIPGAPVSATEIPPMQLDLFATGTVAASGEDQEKHAPAEQPFPGEAVEYRMVYASTGRAMIADDSGLWVVQRGSLLPDNSSVAAIEQRDGKWVLVTSEEKVIALSDQ